MCSYFLCLVHYPLNPIRKNNLPKPSLTLGAGILTSFPSTTPFSLALGTGSPCADYLYAGTLRFSARVFLTLFFVTHVNIRTSDISRIPHSIPSQTYGTLRYQSRLLSIPQLRCVVLAPLHLRRRTTRPVRYYSLFEWVAASKPTSWLSMQFYILFHLTCIRDLSCRSGLFPF